MNQEKRPVTRVMDRLARGLGFLGQLALISMVVTICYDVMMRYVFKRPTMWSLEINTFLVVFLAVIPAGDVLAADSHLGVTFFTEKMGVRTQRLIRLAAALIGCVFSAVMVWKGWEMAWAAYRFDERMSTPLGTPMAIPYLFIPVGFAVLLLQYALTAVRGGSGR
ncbi:MAG: TRAP transporter small permease [Thermodesulfobacteriota bacterium]